MCHNYFDRNGFNYYAGPNFVVANCHRVTLCQSITKNLDPTSEVDNEAKGTLSSYSIVKVKGLRREAIIAQS